MLEIHKLKAGYNGKPVVHIKDLQLKSGEHGLILGNSGSGKTTLLYAVTGLLTPLSGEVKLGEHTITSLEGRAADAFRGKHIGIIYQTLHMVSALTVLQNLLLASYSAGMEQDKGRAGALMEQLGLHDHIDKKPDALSHGQQQRVAIARAAMNKPKLIIGDEPTSALDDENCDTVMRLLLATAKESGASLLVATHDKRIRKHFQKTITLGGSHE